jgi:ribosomal protein S12 methylthiotransferase accessory factor
MAGAKLSALSEVVERDCEGTTPFDRAFCFEIETGDRRLAALLAIADLMAEASRLLA